MTSSTGRTCVFRLFPTISKQLVSAFQRENDDNQWQPVTTKPRDPRGSGGGTFGCSGRAESRRDWSGLGRRQQCIWWCRARTLGRCTFHIFSYIFWSLFFLLCNINTWRDVSVLKVAHGSLTTWMPVERFERSASESLGGWAPRTRASRVPRFNGVVSSVSTPSPLHPLHPLHPFHMPWQVLPTTELSGADVSLGSGTSQCLMPQMSFSSTDQLNSGCCNYCCDQNEVMHWETRLAKCRYPRNINRDINRYQHSQSCEPLWSRKQETLCVPGWCWEPWWLCHQPCRIEVCTRGTEWNRCTSRLFMFQHVHIAGWRTKWTDRTCQVETCWNMLKHVETHEANYWCCVTALCSSPREVSAAMPFVSLCCCFTMFHPCRGVAEKWLKWPNGWHRLTSVDSEKWRKLINLWWLEVESEVQNEKKLAELQSEGTASLQFVPCWAALFK